MDLNLEISCCSSAVYYKQVLYAGSLRVTLPWFPKVSLSLENWKPPLKKAPTEAHLRFYVALSSKLPNRDSGGVPLALISITIIFMIFKFNFLVYCTQQVVLDLCFHMTKPTGNIFSICEIFVTLFCSTHFNFLVYQ